MVRPKAVRSARRAYSVLGSESLRSRNQEVRLLLGQLLRLAYGFLRVCGRKRINAEGREVAAKDFRLERRGAEDECMDGLGRRGRQLRGRSRVGLGAQRDGEREGAADVGFGFHPDFAVHHFDELAADAQAEAGPAVAARGGGVNLPKGWKSWPRNSGAIPTPVSRTKQMICTRRCSGQVSEGSGSACPA